MFKKNKKEGKYDLLVLETCVVENDQNAWIFDLGAVSHFWSSLQETSSFKQLEDGEMTLKVGTGDVIPTCVVVDVKLSFKIYSCF